MEKTLGPSDSSVTVGLLLNSIVAFPSVKLLAVVLVVKIIDR